MNILKKYAWYGTAVVASLALAMVMLVSSTARVAHAAAPAAVNVIIEDADDILDQPTTDIATLTVYALVTGDALGTLAANETIVTFTTTAGTFLTSGDTKQVVQCAIDGTATATGAAKDGSDENKTFSLTVGTYNGTAAAGAVDLVADAADEGCIGVSATLVVPKNQPIGQIVVTAKTTNGVSGSEILTIQAAAGSGDAGGMTIVTNYPTYNAIGYTSSTQSYNPVANGTRFGVQVVDEDGLRLNGKTIQFTTDFGVLADDAGDNDIDTIEGVCDSTTNLGTTAFGTTAGTGTAVGRSYVLLCGTSGSAGKTATITAVVVGDEGITVSAPVTISKKPASADISAVVEGSTITATVTVDGVPAPDNTNIRFSIVPADDGAVASACDSLEDGKASTAIATTPGMPVTVLVTAAELVDGSTTLCDVTDARVYGSVSVVVNASGTTTPPVTGTGGFSATPVFSSSKLAQAVFTGSVAVLDTSLTASGATGAWAQDGSGVFMLYVVNGGFVNDGFKAAFPNGFTIATALTLVGK